MKDVRTYFEGLLFLPSDQGCMLVLQNQEPIKRFSKININNYLLRLIVSLITLETRVVLSI